MPDYGLGRVEQFDDRSRNYPIRALISQPPRSYTWACNINLDQGKEGACVGFSWAHELAAKPVPVPGITNELAFRLYKDAQRVDPWPGEDYSGTSVLAGVQTLKSLGYITEYRWAFGVEDLAVGVSRVGPAVIGVNWHEGMFTPNPTGYITPTGPIAGGHAILVRGYNVRARRFLLHNSWGSDWGNSGTCYLSHDDMGALLSMHGEACIPIKRVLTP